MVVCGSEEFELDTKSNKVIYKILKQLKFELGRNYTIDKTIVTNFILKNRSHYLSEKELREFYNELKNQNAKLMAESKPYSP